MTDLKFWRDEYHVILKNICWFVHVEYIFLKNCLLLLRMFKFLGSMLDEPTINANLQKVREAQEKKKTKHKTT